jgi:hypothetical protein
MSYREGDEILVMCDCWEEPLNLTVSCCTDERRLLLGGERNRICLNKDKWIALRKGVDEFFESS